MDTSTANTLGMLYFGGFGLTLLASPSFCYGANGFLPYFTDPMAEGTTSGWNARSFGGAMTGLAYGAIADPESKTVTKMMAVAALCLCLSIFLAITGGAEFDKNLPGTGINIWQAQIVPHLVVTGALLNAGFGGDDKTKSK